jgi:Holliday junction resolvase RusA-like endonuclease
MTEPFFSGRLPIPPGINQTYRIVYIGRHPRLADTPKAAAFKEDAALCLSQQRDLVRWDVVANIRTSAEIKIYIPVSVSIAYHFPTMWKRDVDGGDKAVIDAIFKHLQLNDNLVVDLHATKQANRQDPHVYVEISIVQE